MSAEEFNAQAKKILLVEDDSHFREVLKDYLEMKGFVVRDANNGLAAKTILELVEYNFDLVITDIRMPEMNGIELLEYILKTKTTPVIVMTGFSELLETKSAFEYGATDFLSKPFSMQDLIKVIDRALNPLKYAVDPNSLDEKDELKYCSVDIDQFISGTKLISDIYIRLGQSKYIKLGHQGAEIDRDRVQQYRDKGITHFHISADDFKRHIDQNLLVVDRAGQKGLSRDRYGSLIKHTTEMILQDMFVEGVDQDKISTAKNWVKNSLTIIADDKNLANLMMVLEEHGGDVYAHGVKVSMYSNLIAKQAGVTSSHILYRITLAGLLHNIGLREIPVDILNKERVLWTQQELKVYESHPIRGRNLLNNIPNVPEDVVLAAYCHHELFNGTGYPEGIRGHRIPAISRIITVADAFIEEMALLKKAGRDFTIDSIRDSALKLIKIRKSDFDPSLVVAFIEVLGITVPPDLLPAKGRFIA